MKRWLLLVLVVATCAGCERRGEPSDRTPSRAAAQAWLRTARFEDADPATTCRPDCTAQEQGFDYARANKIEQPGDCDLARSKAHASEDFVEGCRAYGEYIEAAGQP